MASRLAKMFDTPPKPQGACDVDGSAATPVKTRSGAAGNKLDAALRRKLARKAVQPESSAPAEGAPGKEKPAVAPPGKRLQKTINEKKLKDEERKRAAELLEANAGKFAAAPEDPEESMDAAAEAEEEAWDAAGRARSAQAAWSAADGCPRDRLDSPGFDPSAVPPPQKACRTPFKYVAQALGGMTDDPGCALRSVANLVRLVIHTSTDKVADINAVLAVFLTGEQKVPQRQVAQGIAAAFGCTAPETGLADAALYERVQQRVLLQQKRISVADVVAVLEEGRVPRTEGKQQHVRLTKLLSNSVAEGRETWHVIRVLLGDLRLPSEMVLRALAHAITLAPLAGTASSPSWSDETLRAEAMVGMEDAVLRAYSQDGGRVERLLEAVSACAEPGALLSACKPNVGVPLLPMRPDKAKDIAAAIEKMGAGAVLAEWRLHGERCQVHVQGGGATVNVFGKGLRIRSDRADEAKAILAGHLRGVETCVLEAVFVSRNKKNAPTPAPDAPAEGHGQEQREQQEQQAAGLSPVTSSTIVAFDILELNGRPLTSCTLKERRDELHKVVVENACLKFAKGSEIAAETITTGEVLAMLDEALSATYLASSTEEKARNKATGLILKCLDGPESHYYAGRCTSTWQALEKPPVTGLEAEKMLFESLSSEEKAHLPAKDEFHFAVVSGFRTRSVEGIKDILHIQQLYRDAGVVPTWYVDNECPDEYRKLGLQVVKAGKLIPARNRALEAAVKEGKVCVQTSDDIGSWIYFLDQTKYNADDESNAAWKRGVKLSISPVAAARFLLARMRARGEHCRLGGVYPLSNGGRAMRAQAIGTFHFIIGDFIVVENSDLRFDERLSLKEDYDFTAAHLEKFGEVFRSNRLLITAKHETNAGGACAARDAEGKREQYNIGVLKKKWPGAIGDHPHRANQIILRWKSLRRDDVVEDAAGATRVQRKRRRKGAGEEAAPVEPCPEPEGAPTAGPAPPTAAEPEPDPAAGVAAAGKSQLDLASFFGAGKGGGQPAPAPQTGGRKKPQRLSRKRKAGQEGGAPEDDAADGAAVDEADSGRAAGAEKMRARRQRMLREAEDPDEERKIRDAVYEMEEASAEDKAIFGALVVGYGLHMEANEVKPASIRTYCGAMHRCSTLQSRSPAVMASDEYQTLVRRSFADKKCNHVFSCGLRWFSRFYRATCEKNGGRFVVDPSWEEVAAKNRSKPEPVFDAHGELRQSARACSSKYVGVYAQKGTGKWLAISKKQQFLGIFATQELAAEARSGMRNPCSKSVLDMLGIPKAKESQDQSKDEGAAAAKPEPDVPADVEISMGLNIVSIMDPILCMRIETPVRGKNCQHIGVFDKDAYLEFNAMQERRKFNRLKNLWLCPICNQPTPERSLVVVEDFVKILAAAKHKPDLEHVAALPDGTLSLLD
mmetsp:Transcript_101251/g.287081  ORF Transcript_101251/g.287081 Transcript_101251/m.287081 type:complete len:1411 (-) Transcript_101251:173-4405(-)